MIRLLYNLLWPIGLIVFLPGYLIKMLRRGGYREKFGQRLGIYEAGARTAGPRPTWLHAVSVGEAAIALKLAKEMRVLDPELRLVLTTTTTTGFSFCRKNAEPWIEVMYAPLDFWPIMRRAFAAIRPARIILVEAEVWPNLAAEAHARKIPLALVNARLSPRSEKRFRRFKPFVAPTFRLLDLLCVPEREDVERWQALGVERSRIHDVGSIKYDPENVEIETTAAAKVLEEFKIDRDRPIVLGGSTHAGEEEILGRLLGELRTMFPKLFLIIAPRHVERAREICRTLEQLGLQVALRSQPPPVQPVDCLVLDSTGELRNWYPLATVVFMGKSLTAHGGQNPAEPIIAGKPVMFGPHMENFSAFARELIREHAALQIGSVSELQQATVDLLRRAPLRERLAENAKKVLDTHRGATTRTAYLISNLVTSQASRTGGLQTAG